jgi:exonuclease VII small subunit
MRKIKTQAPLDQAIESLENAVESLDEMIKIMQESQATLRSWLEPGKEIGWVEDAEDKN